MHTTIDYSELQGPEKSEKALKDIENFLGKEKMAEVGKLVKEENRTFKWFKGACGVLIGITGYPVEAWYDSIFPGRRVKEQELDSVILDIVARKEG